MRLPHRWERVLHKFGEYVEGLWKYELCRCALSKVRSSVAKIKIPTLVHFTGSCKFVCSITHLVNDKLSYPRQLKIFKGKTLDYGLYKAENNRLNNTCTVKWYMAVQWTTYVGLGPSSKAITISFLILDAELKARIFLWPQCCCFTYSAIIRHTCNRSVILHRYHFRPYIRCLSHAEPAVDTSKTSACLGPTFPGTRDKEYTRQLLLHFT